MQDAAATPGAISLSGGGTFNVHELKVYKDSANAATALFKATSTVPNADVQQSNLKTAETIVKPAFKAITSLSFSEANRLGTIKIDDVVVSFNQL